MLDEKWVFNFDISKSDHKRMDRKNNSAIPPKHRYCRFENVHCRLYVLSMMDATSLGNNFFLTLKKNLTEKNLTVSREVEVV